MTVHICDRLMFRKETPVGGWWASCNQLKAAPELFRSPAQVPSLPAHPRNLPAPVTK